MPGSWVPIKILWYDLPMHVESLQNNPRHYDRISLKIWLYFWKITIFWGCYTVCQLGLIKGNREFTQKLLLDFLNGLNTILSKWGTCNKVMESPFGMPTGRQTSFPSSLTNHNYIISSFLTILKLVPAKMFLPLWFKITLVTIFISKRSIWEDANQASNFFFTNDKNLKLLLSQCDY